MACARFSVVQGGCQAREDRQSIPEAARPTLRIVAGRTARATIEDRLIILDAQERLVRLGFRSIMSLPDLEEIARRRRAIEREMLG